MRAKVKRPSYGAFGSMPIPPRPPPKPPRRCPSATEEHSSRQIITERPRISIEYARPRQFAPDVGLDGSTMGQVQELVPRHRAIHELAAQRARDGARVLLLDAAHHHAQVHRL